MDLGDTQIIPTFALRSHQPLGQVGHLPVDPVGAGGEGSGCSIVWAIETGKPFISGELTERLYSMSNAPPVVPVQR